MTAPRAALREAAQEIFAHALRHTTIQQAFHEHLSCDRGVLRIRDDLYDLQAKNRVLVIALGKAAHSMLRAFEEQAGEQFEGIVASSVLPEFQARGFRYFHGGHPWPNAESVSAARAMLNFVGQLNQSSLVIYLVSGGGSAAVEKPIDDEISLSDLVESYRVLVHCGAPIHQINAIRKHLSAIKGGRLAAAAYPAEQVSILVSDVPDQTPDALSSGPTMPDSTTVEDCYRLIRGSRALSSPVDHPDSGNRNLAERFPSTVRELFERHALEETPKSDHPAFLRSRWWTVLSNAALVASAKHRAERLGWTVHVDNRPDDWDYKQAADYLLERLRELRQNQPRVCLLSGGEVTVEVEDGGEGGRNQQFALYCAEKVAGQDVCVLSAGSDGIDGNSPAAGAIIDSTTCEKAEARGLDVKAYLSRFDAYSLFAAIGDAIVIGPTGTNLRDLRILLAG